MLLFKKKFQLFFLYKSDLRISSADKIGGNNRMYQSFNIWLLEITTTVPLKGLFFYRDPIYTSPLLHRMKNTCYFMPKPSKGPYLAFFQ